MGGRRGEDRTSVGRQEENKAGPVRVEVKAKAGPGWLNCAQEASEPSSVPVKKLMHQRSAPRVRRHLYQHLVHFEKTSRREWLLERGCQVQRPLWRLYTDVATGDNRGLYLRPWFVSSAGCSGGN